MSNQLRASELLREAANLLNQPRNSADIQNVSPSVTSISNTSSSTHGTTNTTQIRAATRAIFAPYGSQRGRRRAQTTIPPITFWTHKFCVLANCSEDMAPSREEKLQLFNAGLGEKRITFVKSSDAERFKEKLQETFPKLKDCGGYELLRSGVNSRFSLQPLPIAPGGYNTQFLADESQLGQAVCYVRPIQKDLDFHPTPAPVDDDASGTVESCFKCGNLVPLQRLREHTRTCGTGSPTEGRTRLVQVPLCQFACRDNCDDSRQDEKNSKRQCPVCQEIMDVAILEVHAATCGEHVDDMDVIITDKSLDHALEDICKQIEEEKFTTLKVIRRHFLSTAMEQLEMLSNEEWERSFRVKFIGEAGIDAGGLRREFFTLLFEKTDLLEGRSFQLKSDQLVKKNYRLLGKATAVALTYGHPGPKCFNSAVVHYILNGCVPDTIEDKCIEREDALAAIRDLESDADIDTCMKHCDLLQTCGFRKVLNGNTKTEAVCALKWHFGFYHAIAPLQQYVEGLSLHGILELLRRHKADTFFVEGTVTSEDVSAIFQPSYSANDEEKATEELIIYNFNKLLKKVERGLVSSQWIDEYTEETGELNIVTIQMRHILRALLSSDSLPRNTCALIEFDHISNRLSSANVCAPSLTFSQTKKIQDYATFETHMLYIVVGAPGFGME